MSNEQGQRKVIDIPIWKRYLINVHEASEYYHIGEKKIRNLVEIYSDYEFALFIGNKVLIKRKKFEEFLDNATSI